MIIGAVAHILLLFLLLLCSCAAEGSNSNSNDSNRATGVSRRPASIIQSSSSSASSPFELNPNYVVPPHRQQQQQQLRLQDIDKRDGRLLVPQQPGAGGYYYKAQTLSFDDDFNKIKQQLSSQPLSLASFVREAIASMYQTNGPSITNTALACVSIFVLWYIPPCRQQLLQKYFVCSKYNSSMKYILKRPMRVMSSIVLSAFSHAGLLHLAMNMYALLSIGPTVKQMLSSTPSSLSWPMWPLMLGAAITGSVFYLVLDSGSGGGCMGLSGVTLSLLAVYAKFVPKRIVGTAIGGIIPLRLPAMQLVTFLILWSIVGTFMSSVGKRHSNVAHSTHLGGLCFGLVYYELWCRRYILRMHYHRTMRWINTNIMPLQKK